MAFRRDVQRIVPGGINLLAPTDQPAVGDWLQMTNFRPDSAGKLVQSLGLTARNADEGVQLHGIAALKSERFYSGSTVVYKYNAGLVGTVVVTGLDGVSPGMLGFQNFLWIINRSGQKRIESGTTTSYGWRPESGVITSVALTAGAGALAAGDHEYYVTFQDGGWEGAPSAVTTRATGANEINRITRPAATEACSDGWNVYVKRPNLAEPLKLNATAIPIAAVTYDDYGDENVGAGRYQTDANLLDRNEALETNRGAAPAARVMANKPYNGSLIVASSAANPNRLWWTPALSPWYFRDVDYLDVGEDDAILAITVRPNLLIIYKERSIWRHVGELGSGQLDLIAPDTGITGLRAIASASNMDYFAGREGLYECNGDFARKLPVSAKLDPLFLGYSVQIAEGISHAGLDDSYRSRAAMAWRNGRLWFSYVSTVSASHYPDRTVIIDMATGRISSRQSGAHTPEGWSAFLDEGQDGKLLGATSGQIEALDDYTYNDNLSGMTVEAHSAYHDQGLPDNLKEYGDLVIPRHNTQNAALTVAVFTNNGKSKTTYNPGTGAISVDEVAIGTLQSTSQTESIFRLQYPTTGGASAHPRAGKPVRGKNLAVRIEGASGGAAVLPIEVEGPIMVHYRVLPRDAHDFDTGEIDLGQVCEIDELQLEIDAEGTVTLDLQVGLPGGVLTSIAPAPTAISATTDFQVITRAFTAAAGQIVRLKAYSAANVFRVATCRIRARGIGVYLDGAVSQTFKTREEAIGI